MVVRHFVLECKDGLVKCDKCKCVTESAADSVCLDRRSSSVRSDVVFVPLASLPVFPVNCPDGTSETWVCADGKSCILSDWIADSYPDCEDQSDESRQHFDQNLKSRTKLNIANSPKHKTVVT